MKIKRTKISTACKTSGGNAADQIMQVQSRKEKKSRRMEEWAFKEKMVTG